MGSAESRFRAIRRLIHVVRTHTASSGRLRHRSPRLAERAGIWHWSLELEERLLNTFDLLAGNPGIGHRRTDLVSREISVFPVDRYLILYLPDTSPLKIIAVLPQRP